MNTTTNNEARNACLISLLRDGVEITRTLRMYNAEDRLRKVINDFQQPIKISVVGSFRSGKKTTVNSVIGGIVLPNYILLPSSEINLYTLEYNERNFVELTFNKDCHTFDDIPLPLIINHFKKYGTTNVPNLECSLDSINELIKLLESKDYWKYEKLIQSIKFNYPSDFLKDGISISIAHINNINIPNNIYNADVILMVLNATACCSIFEVDFLEELYEKREEKDIFFVINKMDVIQEKDLLKKYANKVLEKYITRPISYISALEALDAIVDKDDNAYEASGIKEFKKSMEDYIEEKKAKKAVDAINTLRSILYDEALGVVIKKERTDIDLFTKEQFEQRCATCDKLPYLKTKYSQLRMKQQYHLERGNRILEKSSMKFFELLITKMEVYITSYAPINDLGIIPTKNKIKNLIYELSDVANQKASIELNNWIENCFIHDVSKFWDSIFINNNYRNDIIQLASEMSSIMADEEKADFDERFWKEFANINKDIFLSDINTKFKNHIINKVDIPYKVEHSQNLYFISILINTLSIGTAHVKNEIKQYILETIRSKCVELSREFAEIITQRIMMDISNVDIFINDEIAKLADYSEGVLKKSEKESVETMQRKIILEESEQRIYSLISSIDKFVFDMI